VRQARDHRPLKLFLNQLVMAWVASKVRRVFTTCQLREADAGVSSLCAASRRMRDSWKTTTVAQLAFEVDDVLLREAIRSCSRQACGAPLCNRKVIPLISG